LFRLASGDDVIFFAMADPTASLLLHGGPGADLFRRPTLGINIPGVTMVSIEEFKTGPAQEV
jgi:hypothetical protein